jgi:cytochrome c oxidase accessory protein FixG
MSSQRPQPNLVSLSTINADGSRKFIHPADVRGPFTLWRRIFGVLLLVTYVALPWIPVGGHPAVFLDVAERRFHFFGLTLATQDLWIGFFLITGLAFSLFYITSLFGRLWCGWTCPYTVFLEHVFRRIERLIDGDAPARRKLEDAALTPGKIARRVIKHALYLLAAALIAHVFMSYFVSIKGLYHMMTSSPREHFLAFGIVLFLTAALYGSFSWFREQFCIILCPYGRLQSALTDDNSVVIGYDKKRGEPRGKASDPNAGDCIACSRCVQVCPTGIDIRNGLQLECIGCAACVDACNEVMAKLHRPAGLIRYDSYVGLSGGKTRLIRPRTILYTVMLAIGASVFAFSITRIPPFRTTVIRMVGPSFFLTDGVIRNQFNLRLVNKSDTAARYHVELLDEGRPPTLTLAENLGEVPVAPLGEEVRPVILTQPAKDYKRGIKLRLRITDRATGKSVLSDKMTFQGPDPRLMIIK